MQAGYYLHAVLLLLSALFTLIASMIAWRKHAPGSFSLGLLLSAMTWWAFFYALNWLPIPQFLRAHLDGLMYIGIVSVPTLFLVFSLNFSYSTAWFNPRLFSFLAIEPVVTILLLWTNQYHHLVFKSISPISLNEVSRTVFEPGFWYELNLGYSYAVIIAGIMVLVYGLLRASPLLHTQYGMILLASLLPWITNVYVESTGNTGIFDWTPLTFGVAGILFTYAVVRQRFMDIIPVARSRLIESMSDGVLVLDIKDRIVDINPAMEKFLGHKPDNFLGQNASFALNLWRDKSNFLLSGEETRTELRVPDSPSRYLDLRVTPLYDHDQRLSGHLMVFRDVTDRKRVEKQLRHANDRLQSQLIEIGTLQSKLRSQAIRDPLTEIFNRRYLDETLDREIARASRENYPVCAIMMDIDHFKKVNDTYGHEAGDLVLKTLARVLSSRNRRGDFACRFGGEEFVIVMPNMTTDVAYQRATELRKTLNSLSITYGQYQLSITISMGISCYPINGMDRETMLRAADRAMYAAKKAGRDHILTYDALEAETQSD